MISTEVTCVPGRSPYYSFVLPVWSPRPAHLAACLSSIGRQTCRDYEVCVVLDGPLGRRARRVLDRFCALGLAQCIIHELPAHAGISAASNAGAAKACGEWLVFVDQDDTVDTHLLDAILPSTAGADALYTDEDKLFGPWRAFPFRKPEPSLHNLMACNYYAHCRAFRREVFVTIGGHDSRFDGAQDWDLFLRFTKTGLRIRHVAEVLYHWRAHTNSTAFLKAARTTALEPARQCLRHHFPDRVYTDATKRIGPFTLPQPGFFVWRMKQPRPVVYRVYGADGPVECDWENGEVQRVRSGLEEAESIEADSFVLIAPMFSVEQLRAGGVLSEAPWYFDPLATTVSFRVGKWGKPVSGGMHTEDGVPRCAAALRRMGLSNVIWECDGPNPDLFLSRADHACSMGSLQNTRVTGSAIRRHPYRAVHLDAPVYLNTAVKRQYS